MSEVNLEGKYLNVVAYASDSGTVDEEYDMPIDATFKMTEGSEVLQIAKGQVGIDKGLQFIFLNTYTYPCIEVYLMDDDDDS